MKQELQVIMDLMKDLQEKMEYSPDDFEERLGKKKPGIEVMKIEGELPVEEAEMGEMPMEEEGMEGDMMEEGPEAALKKRLMKLRG